MVVDGLLGVDLLFQYWSEGEVIRAVIELRMRYWVGTGQDKQSDGGEVEKVGEKVNKVESVFPVSLPLLADQGETERMPHQLGPGVLRHDNHGMVTQDHFVITGVRLLKPFIAFLRHV